MVPIFAGKEAHQGHQGVLPVQAESHEASWPSVEPTFLLQLHTLNPEPYKPCIIPKPYINPKALETLSSRSDKYESSLVLYWVEEEVEGEWQKKKVNTKEETLSYEVEHSNESAAAFMGEQLSLDPTSAHGPVASYE